ncbi:hypothetical protein Pfo_014255 [Paulownia fortunei]|nr:hypothetical protein Pfo_014255 [Paulownia fortunei]
MAVRNRGLPIPVEGGPHGGQHHPLRGAPFIRGLSGVPHPALLEEMMESRYTQRDDIQVLLVDNQRSCVAHVALRQEMDVEQLQQANKFAHTLQAEKDLEMRELYEKSVKMENELHAVNTMRVENKQVYTDIKELTTARQDLTAQVPAIKYEIEGLRHEQERARAAIEHEKKGFAENFEQGKVMENKLISMARDMEKLRAELANSEKRAHAAAAVGNPVRSLLGIKFAFWRTSLKIEWKVLQIAELTGYKIGVSYNANYSNSESGYPGNPYSVGYGMISTKSMHRAPAGEEGYPQYEPGPGAWDSYDTHRAQGPI